MKKIVIGLLTLFVVSACQGLSTGPSSPDVRFSVDPGPFAHDSEHGAIISWSIENRGHDTLYLSRCGDQPLFEVERRENESWVNAVAALCLTFLSMESIPLAPAEVLEGVRGIVGEPGEYRLRIGVQDAPLAEHWHFIPSDSFVIE